MLKLFTWLASFVITMTVVAGLAVYWLLASGINQAREQEAQAVARGAALSIAAHIAQINAVLDKMAQDTDVLTALLARNTPLLKLTAATLEAYLPGSLKIRLLLPDVDTPDDSTSPPMGFSGLAMARQASSENPAPAIQGQKTDRHLAIARRIVYHGTVAGVILASFDPGFVQQHLSTSVTKNVALQLRQSSTVLAQAGAFSAQVPEDLPVISVPGTHWSLAYQANAQAGYFDVSVILAIFLPAFFAGLALFVGYRQMSATLSQDTGNLMRFFKDIMSNNLQGNYPFQLNELRVLFSNLLQLKRVLEKPDTQTSFDRNPTYTAFGTENTLFADDNFNITVDDQDLDLDDLFDDQKPGQSR